jgi:hypothetical protein
MTFQIRLRILININCKDTERSLLAFIYLCEQQVECSTDHVLLLDTLTQH